MRLAALVILKLETGSSDYIIKERQTGHATGNFKIINRRQGKEKSIGWYAAQGTNRWKSILVPKAARPF